jgi:beta-1,4-N-acetylglucosaminyltransferase
MLALKPAWDGFDRVWATLAGADVDYLLAGEQVTIAHGPTNRSPAKAIRNLAVAWKLIRSHRPEAILSTGAGLSVPFFLVGKLLGVRLVYVESVTRTETISLSGRLVYPLADRFFTQWPQSAATRRRAEYAGAIL